MSYGMYLSADGASAMQKRMEVVANNMANVNTVGFKRDVPVFHARFAQAIDDGEAMPGDGSVNDTGGGVYMSQTVTEFAPGTFKTTNKPTDLAIDGDGFFLVRRGREQMLTKAGDFQLNSDGKLITAQGFEVMSDSGSAVIIDPDAGPWQVSPNGTIIQDGVETNIALVRPRSLGDLAKVGDNLFRPLARPVAIPDEERRVQTGCLEMSGVNPTRSMLDIIETTRLFEANMKLIQNHDQISSSLISRVLRT